MLAINWIALVLAVVLHVVCQRMGHSLAMASSGVEVGTPQDIYLTRVGSAVGIAQIGVWLAFITQLIPVRWVKTVGLVVLGISIGALVVARSGVLRRGLPR